jgi:hypothetical protein
MSNKQRCQVCKKKLVLNVFNCKCSPTSIFCDTHRYPEEHKCLFDFKKQHKLKLTSLNPQVVASKIYAI